jgi:hypothetical protein
MGEGGIVQETRCASPVEPPTPWSQTKIHAIERIPIVSYQARPPSHDETGFFLSANLLKWRDKSQFQQVILFI